MASRRPPLFELLQHEDAQRQGQGSGVGRPNALGHNKDRPVEPKNGNGQAQGAVETKPSHHKNGTAERSANTTLEDLSEPTTQSATKPETKQAQAKPRTKHVPAPMPERVPAPKPVETKSEPKAERPAGAADWSGMHPQNAVSVRMMWVYGAIFAVLAVVVGVWALGYKLGVNNEKAELERYLQRTGQSDTIADPMASEEGAQDSEAPPLSGVDRQQEERWQAERTPRVEPAPPVAQPTPEPVPTIDVLVDVRQAGHNYMKLASGMTLERARGLAEHLVNNGVHAMALREGRGYGLYTALGVPSDRFGATKPERDAHADKVVRLLEQTPRDLGGPYDGSGYLWIRFDG